MPVLHESGPPNRSHRSESRWNLPSISTRDWTLVGAVTHGKNLAFKTLTPVSPHSSCQFIVTSYITAIRWLHTFIIHICHKIMLSTRLYIKQLLQTEPLDFFPNTMDSNSFVQTILGHVSSKCILRIINHRTSATTVTSEQVPTLRAIPGAMKRFDDWNQDIPPRCALETSHEDLPKQQNLGVWYAWLRTSNQGWVNVSRFCFVWLLQLAHAMI